MSYAEREGLSKLNVLKDGIRFLKVILAASFLYRPSRLLSVGGILLIALAAMLMLMPIRFYAENHRVLEWMIYRLVVGNLLGLAGILTICVSYLAAKVVSIVFTNGESTTLTERCMGSFMHSKVFWIFCAGCFISGGLLVSPSFLDLVLTGATYEHWSRFIVMSFLYSVAGILIVTRILGYSLGLVQQRLLYLALSETIQ
jgi:hypothetical protein